MHYRVDVRDLWRPGGGESRLTWRLLGNLVRHLPPESATKTALRNQMSEAELKRAAEEADPSHGQWSQLEMLVAQLIDTVRWLVHITAVAHGGRRGKPPEPVPRPGVPPKDKKGRKRLSPEQVAAVLRRIHGEAPLTGGVWRQSPPGKITRLRRTS